jgi:transcriptional regulator with XRE-family HTH domain
MHIGQVIRALREEKSWSQEKLAHEANMTTSHVSRIERGERRMPTTRLDALAAALGTTPANIYAMFEGRSMPKEPHEDEGDLMLDCSAEAVELRRTFRSLPLSSRRLVVDFAKMLVNRRS